MPADMRDYPWQADVAKAGRARARAAWHRFGVKVGTVVATIGLCLAIGSVVGVHWPTLPNYAPTPGAPAVPGPHPAPTKMPHIHVHAYLLYRAARWTFRRGY